MIKNAYVKLFLNKQTFRLFDRFDLNNLPDSRRRRWIKHIRYKSMYKTGFPDSSVLQKYYIKLMVHIDSGKNVQWGKNDVFNLPLTNILLVPELSPFGSYTNSFWNFKIAIELFNDSHDGLNHEKVSFCCEKILFGLGRMSIDRQKASGIPSASASLENTGSEFAARWEALPRKGFLGNCNGARLGLIVKSKWRQRVRMWRFANRLKLYA